MLTGPVNGMSSYRRGFAQSSEVIVDCLRYTVHPPGISADELGEGPVGAGRRIGPQDHGKGNETARAKSGATRRTGPARG